MESEMSADNRRSEERVPVDFQVDYIHEGDYVLSFSKNISLGGRPKLEKLAWASSF